MVSEADMAMIKTISETDDVSAAQVVRLMIRRTYAERFGEKKPPKR